MVSSVGSGFQWQSETLPVGETGGSRRKEAPNEGPRSQSVETFGCLAPVRGSAPSSPANKTRFPRSGLWRVSGRYRMAETTGSGSAARSTRAEGNAYICPVPTKDIKMEG